MQRWQYYQVRDSSLTQEQLNELGKEGWELVCAMDASNLVTFIFKRPY
ncbi:MAG: hypothetical protein QOJ64_3125 [Acidobacteriota bacterium]|jgi:hypothetical protein|nr:hypothetical protein [Acidobacteriota bacterium]